MERRNPLVKLSAVQVSEAVERVLPQTVVRGSSLVERHGKINTNYFLDTSDGPLVLRLHSGGAPAQAKELGILGLVGSKLPAPRVLGYASADLLGSPFSVMERVAGAPLAEWAPLATERPLQRAAHSLGQVLAKLVGHTFDSGGDIKAASPDAPLQVVPFDFGDFYRWCLFETPAGERLGILRDRLWDFLGAQESTVDDDWPVHLVHGDFNPTNVLVTEAGEVTGVIDWEYGHAGGIWQDLGNLLRKRREHPWPSGFNEALADGLRDGGVLLPDGWRERALLQDLSSACEFLSSKQDWKVRHRMAKRQIVETLRFFGEDV